MSELRVAIVPVGRMDPIEVEEAAAHVSRVLHKTVEVRNPSALPKAAEDAARGQFRAPALLAEARREIPRLEVRKLIGTAAAPGTPVPAPRPDATILVTDVDLFTPATDAVLGDLDVPARLGLVSVRRLREAFYRRKADPAKQRARLVKEMLRAIGRLHGLPDCRDAGCALSPSQALADIDRKGERYCAACWRRLSTGAIRI